MRFNIKKIGGVFFILVNSSLSRVNNKLEKIPLGKKYENFYKKQYKKEIISHMFFTILYLFFVKGIRFTIVFLSKRLRDSFNMFKWLAKDTSEMNDNLEDTKLL